MCKNQRIQDSKNQLKPVQLFFSIVTLAVVEKMKIEILIIYRIFDEYRKNLDTGKRLPSKTMSQFCEIQSRYIILDIKYFVFKFLSRDIMTS